MSSTSSSRRPMRVGERRRRTGFLGTVAGVVAALALAAPAAAAQPTVVEEGAYDQSYVVPAAVFPCGVDVTFHEVGTYRVTSFADRGGTVVFVQAHIGGTTTITSAHGEIVNHWRETGRLDPDAETVSWSGNSYNIHGGAGGVLVNRSGHWVEDANSGELLTVAGPHDDPEADIAEICAVLAP